MFGNMGFILGVTGIWEQVHRDKVNSRWPRKQEAGEMKGETVAWTRVRTGWEEAGSTLIPYLL